MSNYPPFILCAIDDSDTEHDYNREAACLRFASSCMIGSNYES
jgi:hypothetical protein